MSQRLNKELVSEINDMEEKRGRDLKENPEFLDWVRRFRKEYLVDGFLTPFYARNGDFSISGERVNQFGDYILPLRMIGQPIKNTANEHIHNEKSWFWFYLREGQDAISQLEVIPYSLKIEGIPANLIWREIVSILLKLDLLGEKGGGIISREEIDTGYFAGLTGDINYKETGNKFTERLGERLMYHWMTRYLQYERTPRSKSVIEIRPAWFQIARYAFFDIPLYMPVFSCTYSAGQIVNLRFLSDELTDKARAFIGGTLIDIPVKLKSIQPRLTRELDSIKWWLWHNVGNFERGKRLSYGEIGVLEDRPRTTIRSAVKRLEKELEQSINGERLGLILSVGSAIRLDINHVYNTLAEQCLVPERETEIDGFDDLDKLI